MLGEILIAIEYVSMIYIRYTIWNSLPVEVNVLIYYITKHKKMCHNTKHGINLKNHKAII